MEEENIQVDEKLVRFRESVNAVRQEIKKLLVGQDQLVDLMMVSLFTKGHILLEGVPGLAKTMGAKLFAQTLSVNYSRIQFTPDLMPSDVVGTSVFNLKNSEFVFNSGPVFSNIVLIDEINRAPAKTQAALFEVMEERQVTVDGTTYPMEFPFMIIATQNPIEQEGTYRLPEAQLDRFLFKIKLDYPNLEEEKLILRKFRQNFSLELMKTVKAVLKEKDIKEAGQLIEKVHIKDEILDYIAEIIFDTRNNGDLFLGASPRASLALMRASKAVAAINARDFVIPDDVKFVSKAVLNHRIILNPDRELEGMEPEDVIEEIIKKTEVPR
ncbi:magnesium chelatase, subunit I, putative ATPase [Fulvivirga imtechensis AK7]|uniref:Magnesium chelatase, subunit I, putative ATPase n=1 Tax=Fulvivirga imtechensis AK7 TaxID=1237149 RepID=L8K0E7_9BACT|nr:MoxR family ATPase [Fulvivirga imtechensis]ELR73873.1 magnesium chelatase, subunit I, putative ATPase [Fulvivirga imtechensis AK7]